MTKPRKPPVATIEIAGHLLCCGPCQRESGTNHPPPHVYTYWNFGHLSPTGITRIEWVDVPKPKRAKARGGSAAKAKRKGGRRG